jgi:hypothetical protein
MRVFPSSSKGGDDTFLSSLVPPCAVVNIFSIELVVSLSTPSQLAGGDLVKRDQPYCLCLRGVEAQLVHPDSLRSICQYLLCLPR